MTKEELEIKVSIQKDIIRNANYQIYSDVNKYIKSLPFKVNDKVDAQDLIFVGLSV